MRGRTHFYKKTINPSPNLVAFLKAPSPQYCSVGDQLSSTQSTEWQAISKLQHGVKQPVLTTQSVSHGPGSPVLMLCQPPARVLLYSLELVYYVRN